MATLDKSRPFSTHFGFVENGSIYSQDGKDFNGDGTETEPVAEAVPEPEPAVEAVPEPEPEPAVEAVPEPEPEPEAKEVPKGSLKKPPALKTADII